MEEKRPGQYYPVEEEGHYSYILNAKDLCLIEYLDKLAKAGVHSFKIEGRAKSAYYTAVTAGAYRAATDPDVAGSGALPLPGLAAGGSDQGEPPGLYHRVPVWAAGGRTVL